MRRKRWTRARKAVWSSSIERDIRTRPVFPGDDWDELRDEMACFAADAVSILAGRVDYFVQRGARAVGAQNDPLARALRAERLLDLRCFYVAHAHLAAVYRLQEGLLERPRGTADPAFKVLHFHDWLRDQPEHWFLDNPHLIYLFATVLAEWQTSRTVINEIALWDELKVYLPLPAPDNLDLFDDPDSYSPYAR